MSSNYGLTDDEAQAVLADQAHRVRTVWRALDLDGDGIISADEIDLAPSSLLALDGNGDGKLTSDEMGGPFRWKDGPRASAIVRILDRDGDAQVLASQLQQPSRSVQEYHDDATSRVGEIRSETATQLWQHRDVATTMQQAVQRAELAVHAAQRETQEQQLAFRGLAEQAA